MREEGESKFGVADQIVAFKRSMAPRREALRRAFDEVNDHVRRAADAIREDMACLRPVVPEIDYRDIRSGSVSEGTRQAIRRTGCAVVRGVFPTSVASDWFAELGVYLEANNYEQREIEKRSLDKYFCALKAGKPQIFNVYWSKPQVMARQDPKLAETRAFLDRLWTYEGVFDPDKQCTYADDVAEDDLCGAKPGRALGISPEWPKELAAGMVSIPEVQPGDTAWWHSDICHAVGDEHGGEEYASVIYIGSAPDCAKNRAYLPKQKVAFLAGRSAPDFAAMDFEVDFKGRATVKDLTELGRQQMGF